MNLTLLSIRQPVLILMVMAAAIMGGFAALRSMRVEQNPDVQFGVVTITTTYPGAGPDEVNSLITKKIEDAISGIANTDEVTASSLEGVSSIVLRFKIGADMQAALSDIRSKVDTVIKDIPNDADRPIVEKLDTASEPVLTMAVSSPTLSNRQLRDLVDKKIKDRISRIDGVSSVGVSGGEVREIQVQLRRDDLLRYKVGIIDVQQAIQGAALNVPAGRIIDSGEEYTVRMLGDFSRTQDLADMYLSISDGKGRQGEMRSVRLGDIADIKDTSEETRTKSRLNGHESVIVVVQKSNEGNAVEISKALRQIGPNAVVSPKTKQPVSLLKSLEDQYNLNFQVTYDVSKTIQESLDDLTFAIAFGILLVTVVIFLFLHNLRGTLIVATAIPLCIFASLGAYWVFGFTINNMSMLALSLAVGVLVDDAIVIIENTYRHLTMGEDPEDAAVNGRTEIGVAAIAITLADVVVFFPIGVMGGISGQFFKPLGLGYVVCVLFSLMVSFTVTPMLAAKWYRKGEDWEHPKGGFAHAFEEVFHRFATAYGRAVHWALRNRWSVFSGGFVILLAIFGFIGGSMAPKDVIPLPNFAKPMSVVFSTEGIVMLVAVAAAVVSLFNGRPKPQWLVMGVVWSSILVFAPVVGHVYRWSYKQGDAVFKFGFFPVTDTGRVTVSIELPPGASLSETEAVAGRIEKIVMKHPWVEFTTANLGTSGGGGFAAVNQGTNLAAVTATLYDKAAWMDKLKFWEHHEGRLRPMGYTAERVSGDFTESIGKIPGVKLSIAQSSDFGGGAAIQLSLQSTDRALLAQAAARIRDGLASGRIPGVVNPDLSTKPGKPELQAVPDRARLADSDITASQLGVALRTMYEGNDDAKFRVNGEEYDIRVMMNLEDRNNPALLKSVPISFSGTTPTYLSDVADVRRGQGYDRIDRRNRMEEVMVNADLLPGVSFGPINDEIMSWVKKDGLVPPGVVFAPVGQARIQGNEAPILFATFLTGIVLVYMVLSALYNNMVYPFIVQLAQPQALVGALIALIITDKPLNVVGFVGLVALVGLVGKNAILLVDYANTLRKRGEDRDEAVIHSGRTRMRPILMTTIALIVGMLPVALAIGRGSEFRETIGITIIGGASLSTLLTLFVIPCSYTIFDDLLVGFGKLMKRFSRHHEEPAPAASAEQP